MIQEADLDVRIGDSVECCLDCEDVHETWYTGVVRDIQQNYDFDGYNVSIDRDDGTTGSGTDRSWETIVTEETLGCIKCIGGLKERAKRLGFSIGNPIDVVESYRRNASFRDIEFPAIIRDISTCDNRLPGKACIKCPGVINGLCFGMGGKFIAFKTVGEWNEEEN